MGEGAGWLKACPDCGADDCACVPPATPRSPQDLAALQGAVAELEAGEARAAAVLLARQDDPATKPEDKPFTELVCGVCGGVALRIPLPACLAHFKGRCIAVAYIQICVTGETA